jgi:trans-aconitate methyltransferase
MQDDWNPGAYDAFRDFRLRPALDLLARVPGSLPNGDVIDLGCGSGAVGAMPARPVPRAAAHGHRRLARDARGARGWAPTTA